MWDIENPIFTADGKLEENARDIEEWDISKDVDIDTEINARDIEEDSEDAIENSEMSVNTEEFVIEPDFAAGNIITHAEDTREDIENVSKEEEESAKLDTDIDMSEDAIRDIIPDVSEKHIDIIIVDIDIELDAET